MGKAVKSDTGSAQANSLPSTGELERWSLHCSEESWYSGQRYHLFKYVPNTHTVVWLIPFIQMGWHISALNMIQNVLTCNEVGSDIPDPDSILNKLPPCIHMNNATFSVVTAAFTVGGLVGSLMASYSVDRFGRKGALLGSSSLYATGSGIMAGAHNAAVFGVGR